MCRTWRGITKGLPLSSFVFLAYINLDPGFWHRWNVFHYTCRNNDVEGIRYLIGKLEQEDCDALLREGSKDRINSVRLHLCFDALLDSHNE